MISSIVSRLVILVFGTLYPAYASYKAVRTKNVKEYVKWMMYWIVFALFTCAETFTDVFLSFWFPFYYEIKIILVLWLLSPATKGSSILYRKFVHPMLSRREQEIDEYIAKAKEQGYHTVLHLGTKGVNYATTVLMQTAIKGGGGLVNQLRRSYSLSDLSSDKESEMTRSKNVQDEDDMEETDGLDPRMLRPRGYSPRRSASGSGRVEMYFPEVDVDVRQHSTSRPREPSIPLSHIRSSEDVSSGYSSAEPLYAGHHTTKSEGLTSSREPLVRTASVGSTRSMRTKSSRGGVITKRGPVAEDSDFFKLQSDGAIYINQEEFYYTKSSPSSPASYVPSTPQEQFTDASEEELPLFDAETDIQSNDFSVYESMTHDFSIETPSSKDLTISASESTTVPHPFTLSSEINEFSRSESVENPNLIQSQNKDVAEDNQTLLIKSTNNVKPDNLTCSDAYEELNSVNSIHSAHTASSMPETLTEPSSTENQSLTALLSTVETSLAEKQSPTALLSIEKTSLAEKESPIAILSTAETSVAEKQSPTALLSIVKTSLAEKESPIAILSTVETSLAEKQSPTALLSIVKTSLADKQSPTGLPSTAETSLAEEEVATIKSPPTHALSLDNSKHTKNTSVEDSSLIEKGYDQCLSVVVMSPSSNSCKPEEEIETGIFSLSDESVSETQPAEATSPLTDSSIEPLSPDNTVSESLQVNPNENEAGKLKDESSESLALSETPSRSNSQTSLRKEGRAGRYYKHHAPIPPPSIPQLEDKQLVTPTLDKKEETDDSETAITTARLVLKPGVVRSLGPDPNTKTEIFVSKIPQTKSKRFKSKQKQGDSSISRLFAIPKNQFGSLTSLLPFWHGKQEPSSNSNQQSSEEFRAPLADSE